LTDAVHTARDVAIRIAIETFVSAAIALPATAAITFAYFGGDLSQSVSGWTVLRFGLEVAFVESLVICPLVAVRGVVMLRKLNNLRDRLHAQASRDPLTGLLNRRGFNEGALALAVGEPLAVVVADIDHFKRVNDRNGHDAGDEVLRAVAQALGDLAAARPSALLARFGGDEFVIALPKTGLTELRLWADTARVRLQALCVAGPGAPIAITASFGVVTTEAFDGAVAPLISRADAGLYQAKRLGRNRVAAALDSAVGVAA